MPAREVMMILAMAQAACSPPEGSGQGKNHEGQHPDASAVASASTTKNVAVSEENEVYSFSYSFPAAAAVIPGLAAVLNSRSRAAKEQLVDLAQEERQVAKGAGYAYHPHSYAEEWKLVSDLPGWISLKGEFSTYQGGAHGNYGVTSLVWDTRHSQALAGIDLFLSPASLDAALGKPFCAELNRQREVRRGMPVDPASTDIFDTCPGVSELTVIPASSNGKTFDRIDLYAGPYVAGPYAEGSYEVTLPVDAQILGAVKPEYQGPFGTMP